MLASGFETARSAGRLALVIGNSAYENVPVLANPTNDAAAMADKLTSLGFDVIKGVDLNLNDMRQTVRKFVNKLDGADIALFFYAGHGLQVNGQNYMAPIDATLSNYNDLEFEAVPINLVLSAMERNSNTNLVFLDACRNNPLAVNLARSLGTRSAVVGRGLAAVGSGVGTLVSFSTEPGNVALDGEGLNSPYTAALVNHLGTPGPDIATSMIRVRRDVLKATNGKQVPWEHSSLTGEIVLKQLAVVKTDVDTQIGSGSGNAISSGVGGQQTEFVFWNSVKDSSAPGAFEAYLNKYPNGVFAELAKISLGQLKQRQANGVQSRSADNSAEIAYWSSIESGGSAVFFKSYLARYPNGLFVEIANLKLAVLGEVVQEKPKPVVKPDLAKANDTKSAPKDELVKTALLTPPTAPVEPKSVNERLDRDGMRQVQSELNRLGCEAGSPDGLWGKGSRRALNNYSKHSKIILSSLEPTGELLRSLRDTDQRICPIVVRKKPSVVKKKKITKRVTSAQQRSPPKRRAQRRQAAPSRRKPSSATLGLDLGDPQDLSN
ncbi:MAG: caspase family protein [Rhizobiaceae bacterium]|nr:caspase family protein [Rhizobiaceae bacterium]